MKNVIIAVLAVTVAFLLFRGKGKEVVIEN